jgi:Icc-related predicted phosphoesterase
MNVLVVGDVHLRPTGAGFDVESLPIREHDLVVTIGDVVDDNRDDASDEAAGAAYEAEGRAFFERLDEAGRPVVAVPGNHDPLACTRRLTGGLENVVAAHETVVGAEQFPDAAFEGLEVAAWGCVQFDFTPAIPAPAYPEVPAVTPTGSRSHPTAVAETVERSVGRYLAGSITEADLRDRLVVTDGARFERRLQTLEARFQTLRDLLHRPSGPVLAASHVSPFGVPFDKRGQHSRDGNYHFGSLGLKLAALDASPVGLVSGHTHERGTTAVETAGGYTYFHNPGPRGVTSLAVDADGVDVSSV